MGLPPLSRLCSAYGFARPFPDGHFFIIRESWRDYQRPGYRGKRVVYHPKKWWAGPCGSAHHGFYRFGALLLNVQDPPDAVGDAEGGVVAEEVVARNSVSAACMWQHDIEMAVWCYAFLTAEVYGERIEANLDR